MAGSAVRRAIAVAARATDHLYRWGAPAGAVALAAVTLVLFQSLFWAAHVPWLLKVGVAAVAVVSVVSPPSGLLVVAGLSPLGYMLTTRVTDAYPARLTEAIALAFLRGIRGVEPPEAIRPARVQPPACPASRRTS